MTEAAPLAAIVPRWEWRAFGDSFGPAEPRLAALPRKDVVESDEVYLLSLAGDASVKVRGGQMDVKRLEAVNDDGLQQWRPILKAEFPLSREDIGIVLEALGVAASGLPRLEYTFEQLLDELVEPSPELLAVPVRKRREHLVLDVVKAELSEFSTEAAARRTVAVESEDPLAVTAALHALELDASRNVSVARGLKALVGFGARRYAVIDVGTNSVKFLVGERAADGSWSTIVDRAEVTRLGEGLDDAGALGAEPMERTAAVIAAMADEARADGLEAIAAVATAGVRLASNGAGFVQLVHDRCGVDVEVIPGNEEARLAYLATRAALPPLAGDVVVFDTGGGSSQFTFGRADSVDEQFSVPVGAARYTERFGLAGAVDEQTVAAALAAIRADLSALEGRPHPDGVVAMGGAVTNLAAVSRELEPFDPDAIQGTVLGRDEIDRQIELYRTRSADERRRVAGLQPKRAEVILAGACIVRTVLGALGAETLTVSVKGLRHRLLVERFGGERE